MSPITIPNRPFSSEPITGLMLPDGFFEASLGAQRINAHFSNVGATDVTGLAFSIESVSHPGIAVTPATHSISRLGAGASTLASWDADFSGVPSGAYRISFIVDSPNGRTRVIKKIFVSHTEFDVASRTFRISAPEGVLEVGFTGWSRIKQSCCPNRDVSEQLSANILDSLRALSQAHDPTFTFCALGLPTAIEAVVTSTPPYGGQYGDTPYQDVWWKVLIAIIAAILAIAAAIVGGSSGPDPATASAQAHGDLGSNNWKCCGVAADGGSSSYVAAGLTAAAAALAVIAAASDVRDPFRRGQDHTMPTERELTMAEKVEAVFDYLEPIIPGKPFAVGIQWNYSRVTSGGTYEYSVGEIQTNTHVLTRYEISCPDVIRTYKEEKFIVKGQFFDAAGDRMSGASLFVQCFLAGPAGQWRSFVLQDDGLAPDDTASDGVYSGGTFFGSRDRGIWSVYVVAQDVNDSQPEWPVEDQARVIGGMVLTHQLTISFEGGTCPLVPDGHVHVV